MLLFQLPKQVPVSGGNVYAGGKLYFFRSGTSTAATVYSDSTLSTAHATPVVASSAGVFPAIYLDESVAYKARLSTSAGSLIYEVDPINAVGTNQGLTAAESLAGLALTDLDTDYEPGDVRRYKATGDGVTNDAAALNNAYSLAGRLYHPPGTYYLGTAPLTIPANTELTFARGAKFTVASGTAMPQAYLCITGSNVTIDGAVGYIAANPFTTYAQRGAFIGLCADSISNITIRNCDVSWFMHGVFGSHTATSTANSVSNVTIENSRFTCYATDIYHTGKSPLNWKIRNTTHDGTRATPSNNAGAIGIYPGVNIASVDAFTQTNYATDYGDTISVSGCQVGAVKDRPIRFINCVGVTVTDNRLKLAVGAYLTGGAGTTYSADALTFDLCRQVVCSDNQIYGGGENGIDFLSCQDFVCANNTIKQCDTTGIYVMVSDLMVSSATTPDVDLVTDRTAFQTSNGEIYGNYVESFYSLYVGAGQNVAVHDNHVKLYTGSSYWSTQTPLLIALNNSAAADFFAESANHWMRDVRLYDNQPVLGAPVSVTVANATDLFSTVGSIPHGFLTGTKVETIPGGAGNTVDYPGGLAYQTEYYAIYVSASTFKLATTLANARAGTAIPISTDGLTVVGSKLYVRESAVNTGVDISASYYTPANNITLDANIPGHSAINLFSTFPVINPSTAFLFKHSRHWFIYDPAVNYSIVRSTLPKMQEILPRNYDGTETFGISPYSICSGGYQFVLGSKPDDLVGDPSDGYVKTILW